MSVRLFDIPHRKNSTVTSENSTICPTGNTGRFVSPCVFTPALIDVETCMHYLSKIRFHWQTNFWQPSNRQKKSHASLSQTSSARNICLRPPSLHTLAGLLLPVAKSRHART